MKKTLHRIFDEGGSAVRFLVRAVVICITAFGTALSVDQVAAIQLLTEAALQVGVLLFPHESP